MGAIVAELMSASLIGLFSQVPSFDGSICSRVTLLFAVD